MPAKGKLRELSITQKYDCRSFYRTSKTNKAAKRASKRRMRAILQKLLNSE
jgi:hypothetical protein